LRYFIFCCLRYDNVAELTDTLLSHSSLTFPAPHTPGLSACELPSMVIGGVPFLSLSCTSSLHSISLAISRCLPPTCSNLHRALLISAPNSSSSNFNVLSNASNLIPSHKSSSPTLPLSLHSFPLSTPSILRLLPLYKLPYNSV
jgi:hypothetical protein